MLDHIQGGSEDRHVPFNRVVDGGLEVNVLAQDNDRFNSRPPERDLVYVASNPHAACRVHHLFFDRATWLAMEFTQEDISPVGQHALLICQVSLMRSGKVSLILLPGESKPHMDCFDLKVQSAEGCPDTGDRRPDPDANGVSSLVK
jgi:hypothetical protein